MLRIALKN